MLGASSVLLSYLAPFQLPRRESQAWRNGDLGSDAGLPVFLKAQALECWIAGPIRMLQTCWKGLGPAHSRKWFCPAHHPGDGACGPLSFSQQSYLYSSSAEVLIISKHTWSDTAASGHIPFHLVRISLFFVCKPPTHPFKLTFSLEPQLPAKIGHLHLCPPKARSITALRSSIILPPQTVSVSNTRSHLYFTVFIT